MITERIVRQGRPKFRLQSQAKTMRGWINGWISRYAKNGNTELEFLFREVLNAYNHFHPETSIEVEVKGWKGKSSFHILKKVDGLTIIKHQRPDKHSEPQEVRTEVSKEELIALINAIGMYQTPEIKTSQIAVAFSWNLKLGHKSWREFFADRFWHNKLTLMLGALDELGFIVYSGGITRLTNNKLTIQEVLK